jgi:asparagine synthase (glutamine-hydrolysing)
MGGNMAGVFADKDAAIFKLLDPAAVSKLHADHLAGRHDNHKVLFSLIVLEEWLRGLPTEAVAEA